MTLPLARNPFCILVLYYVFEGTRQLCVSCKRQACHICTLRSMYSPHIMPPSLLRRAMRLREMYGQLSLAISLSSCLTCSAADDALICGIEVSIWTEQGGLISCGVLQLAGSVRRLSRLGSSSMLHTVPKLLSLLEERDADHDAAREERRMR